MFQNNKILILVGLAALIIIIGISSKSCHDNGILEYKLNIDKSQIDEKYINNQETKSLDKLTETQNIEDIEIIKKIKSAAKKDWPNDYVTQEYWINEQITAYRYMKNLPNDNLKKSCIKDWPIDFVTQRYWYNENLKAQQRIK